MSDFGNFTITKHNDGVREVGGNAYMDRETERGRGSYSSRPSSNWRGRGGGRGNYRGRPNRRYQRRGYSHDTRYEVNPRSRFEVEDDDGDIAMEGDSVSRGRNNRFTPYQRHGRRGGQFQGGRGNVHSRLGGHSGSDQGTWSRILIPQGRNHDQKWLLNKLRSISRQTFEPVEGHYVGDNFVFFLEDQEVANALKSISGRITCKDNSKIFINVRSCPPPRITKPQNVEVDSKTEGAIMASLASRYSTEENCIDLNNILGCTVLRNQGIADSISLSQLLPSMLQVIHDKCPNVKGLNLSDNNLHSLDLLKSLSTMTPDLESLNLKDNKIRGLFELKKIQSLKKLQVLDLRGNPAARSFSKFESYVSEVRDFFPKLITLDETSLPAPITFDLPSASNLPKSLPSFVPDPKAGEVIMTFVTQYFACYDKDDRQELLEVYHDQAIFSLSVNTAIHSTMDRGVLQNFFEHSRNLQRVKDKERRSHFVKHTRLSVVGLLNELRKTKHYLDSFHVDVSVANAASLCFTIRGIFNDVESNNNLAFVRTFMGVPSTTSGGLKIINDQLHIRPLTEKQAKEFTKPVTVLPEVPPLSQQSIGAPSSEQMVIVQKFMSQSGMTQEYSLQCLQENQWDYAKAAQVFTTLKTQGLIPAEAFQRQ